MGDPTGLSYSAAARRLKRPDLQRQLSALGAQAERLGLRKQSLRELLLAAGAGGSDPDHLLDVARLLEMDRFLALAAPAQVEVARTLARLSASRFLTVSLLDLVELGLFSRLSEEMSHLLLRYLAGPTARSHPRRSSLLAWHARRGVELLELADRLRSPDRERMVRSFLDEVVRPLHLVRTAEDFDLAIVLFGDLLDRRSLSYEKSVDFARSGLLSCRIFSPARSLRQIARLEIRTARLSRLEEIELVSWLENNHLIEDGGVGSRDASLSSSFDFDRRTEEIARIVASSRGPLAFERNR